MSADLAGLAPETTYHYRVVADSLGGTALGADRTFTTGDGSPPNTRIRKAPRRRILTSRSRARATFKFTSSEPGSSFRCKLDGKPFRPCTSPKRLRVKPGRHRFKVRAIDQAGNVDPTPATARWRVVRR